MNPKQHEVRKNNCQPYESFKERFNKWRKYNTILNNSLRSVFQGDNQMNQKEFQSMHSRNAVVNILATWEAFVQDMFEEVTDILLYEITMCRDISQLPKKPQSLIEAAFKGKFGNGAKPKDCMQLVCDQTEWRRILDEYMQNRLQTALNVTPIFISGEGIDKKLKHLLLCEANVSSVLIEQGPLKHSFIWDRKRESDLVVNDVKGLNDILRLYYGARCVFAHGKSEQTFKKGAALGDYPQAQDIKNSEGNTAAIKEKTGVDREIAERLAGLYYNVKVFKHEANVSYATIVNLQRFIMILSKRLFFAISKILCDEYNLIVWGYDPTRAPTNMGEGNYEEDDFLDAEEDFH